MLYCSGSFLSYSIQTHEFIDKDKPHIEQNVHFVYLGNQSFTMYEQMCFSPLTHNTGKHRRIGKVQSLGSAIQGALEITVFLMQSAGCFFPHKMAEQL